MYTDDEIVEILKASARCMSFKDLHEEFGIPDDKLRRLAKLHEIDIPSPKECRLMWLRSAGSHYTIAEICAKLKMGETHARVLCIEAGITPKLEVKKSEEEPVKSLKEIRALAAIREHMKEYQAQNTKTIKSRIQEPYTQSGSPFGIADSLQRRVSK